MHATIETPETLAAFRGLTGQFATAVSVVIALTGGEPFGTTAGSVVAVSMNPAMLGVSFRIGSRMDRVLQAADRFTVNILGETDQGLATRFSLPDRATGRDAFPEASVTGHLPSPPHLAGALAWAECTVTQAIEFGDHRFYAGEVLEMGRRDSTAPLIYYRGRYRGLGSAVAPPTWNSDDSDDMVASW